MSALPFTDEQVIESLDWQHPCESLYHDHRGDGPAAWLVRWVPCCDRPEFSFYCNGCLSWLIEPTVPAVCSYCGVSSMPSSRCVKSTEPIGRKR